jgi:hypothetical protein
MKDNTSEQENSTSLDAENLTAEKVIEIFKNQGFNFSSVEKFQEQFETLLGNTSYGIKKKRRLCRILQKDLNRAWYTYNDKYRVMKIKAGGQALRIVRNEKTICDFLNYGDYKKKYANQTFGRRHKNI